MTNVFNLAPRLIHMICHKLPKIIIDQQHSFVIDYDSDQKEHQISYFLGFNCNGNKKS